MTDRQKPKSANAKTRNDARPSGKKSKGPNPHTRPTRLSGVEKVLLGKGRHVVFGGVGSDPSTQNTGKGR